jgi:5,10-methylene-tetrahydrofolate dehydrogenase/methenyl tetrahydrofolate cyclohydrolase
MYSVSMRHSINIPSKFLYFFLTVPFNIVIMIKKNMVDLTGKEIIITGGAKRIGRHLRWLPPVPVTSVIIHYGQSEREAFNSRMRSTAWGQSPPLSG